MEDIKKAIVIGLAPQGLFILRELHKAGFDVICIGQKDTIGYYSRYGKKISIEKEKDFKKTLVELSKKYGTQTVCYITSGPVIDWIVHNFPDIYDLFDVLPQPRESVEILCNKKKSYDLARENHIPTIEAITLNEIALKKNINFPYIAKWNRELFHFSTAPFKTKIIRDENDIELLKKSTDSIMWQHILIQPLVETPQSHNVSFLGYFIKGECILSYIGQQLRQYPQGITSYIREYKGPGKEQIYNGSKAIFAAMKYSGFGEAEYKFDEDFSNAYFLETNPRPCGWSKALKGKYVNLNRLWTKGSKSIDFLAREKSIEWVNGFRDIYGIIETDFKRMNFIKGILNLTGYFKPRIYDILDLNDLPPTFHQIKKFFSRQQA